MTAKQKNARTSGDLNGGAPETGQLLLKNVTCRYAGASDAALEGFSLEVAAGQFVSVLGPSGSGKTTALRVIAGFERVQSGEVFIGRQLASNSRHHVPPEQRRVGFVFQDYALFPHLTVVQNVAFGIARQPMQDRDARIGPIMEMAGLRGLESRFVHELSGGQQQRVALARSLAARPVALLLDEPFSNLDRHLRSSLRREVRDIVKAAETTAILVTHDREEAMAIADRVAVMGSGRIIQVDAPETIYAQPATPEVARMVGPADTLPGTVRGAVVETEAGRFRFRAPAGRVADGEHVQAVLRAHELEFGPITGGPDMRVAYREFRGEFTQYGIRLPSGMVVRVRRRSLAPVEVGTRVTITAPFDRPVLVYPL
ncbi:MAG: ABC transporter ATP-binding protein [Chloroflexi bacterium]|nr:ABC transporter ATP-binding protein [Chloroflexota bacterium]